MHLILLRHVLFDVLLSKLPSLSLNLQNFVDSLGRIMLLLLVVVLNVYLLILNVTMLLRRFSGGNFNHMTIVHRTFLIHLIMLQHLRLIRILLILLLGMLSLMCLLLDLCLRGDDYVGELPEDALIVEAELGLGLDPERPVDEFEKLGLKQIHLLEADAAHEGQEVVAVEHVVVELGCEQNC